MVQQELKPSRPPPALGAKEQRAALELVETVLAQLESGAYERAGHGCWRADFNNRGFGGHPIIMPPRLSPDAPPPSNAARLISTVARRLGPHLLKLDLACNGLRPEGAERLAEAFASNSFPRLRVLNLSGNELGSSGMETLVGAFKLPSCKLTTLLMDSNVLRSQGAAQLAVLLREQPTLTELSVTSNALGAEGLAHLVLALAPDASQPAPGLRALDISGNALGPAGGIHLQRMLAGNTSLESLSIADNFLGTGGSLLLKGLAENSTVTAVFAGIAGKLGGNGFTPQMKAAIDRKVCMNAVLKKKKSES